jgi:nitroreductase
MFNSVYSVPLWWEIYEKWGIRMDLTEAILTRRSIRKFKPDPVPREILEKILKLSMCAPSGMNTQPWEYVVVSGEKRDGLIEIISTSIKFIDGRLKTLFKEKMQNIIHGFFKDLGGAPVVVLVLTGIHSKGYVNDSAVQSVAAMVQNLSLLAHAEGLGSCWMVGPNHVQKEIFEYLGITDKQLVALLPIGYPDQSPPVPPRKHETINWVI